MEKGLRYKGVPEGDDVEKPFIFNMFHIFGVDFALSILGTTSESQEKRAILVIHTCGKPCG